MTKRIISPLKTGNPLGQYQRHSTSLSLTAMLQYKYDNYGGVYFAAFTAVTIRYTCSWIVTLTWILLNSVVAQPLLNARTFVSGSTGSKGGILHGRRDLRGGGKKGTPPARKEPIAVDRDARARPGTMESEELLAGNVQRLQFLRARGGIDLGVSCADTYHTYVHTGGVIFVFDTYLLYSGHS